MTWQDLLDNIRKGLNDPTKVRWTDSDIVQKVNATRAELWGLHPEAFYVSSIVVALPSDPDDSNLGSSIDFTSTWTEAVMSHVMWQCYMDDSDETQNVKLAENRYAVWAKKVWV